MDVTIAFLNGDLDEEVYMKQPEGFEVKGQEHLICKLKRNIYGLKQAPRCWNTILDVKLKKMGFIQSTSDPCTHTSSKKETFVIAVFVDDIILAGKTDKRIREVKEALAKCFKVKNMGDLHNFLEVTITTDHDGKTWIGQNNYTTNVLGEFGMEETKPVSTPVDVNSKLLAASDDSDLVGQRLYQSAVGSLLYLSCWIRPDITFAVSNVARFAQSPPNNIGLL